VEGSLARYVLWTISRRMDEPRPPEKPSSKDPEALSLGLLDVPELAFTVGSRALRNFMVTRGVKHSLGKNSECLVN
jgi:hypothetical protein